MWSSGADFLSCEGSRFIELLLVGRFHCSTRAGVVEPRQRCFPDIRLELDATLAASTAPQPKPSDEWALVRGCRSRV